MNYVIERQLPGLGFTPVATISSLSNDFRINSYSFSDTLKSAYVGTISYRIRLDLHSDTSLLLFEKSYQSTGPCFAIAELKTSNCINKLEWSVKDDTSVTYSIAKKLPKETSFTTIATLKGLSDELKTNNYSFTDTLKKVYHWKNRI